MTSNTETLFDIRGKIALVSGGGRGIGLMITNGLMKAGLKKVYICSRDFQLCKEVSSQLNEQYKDSQCIPLQGNLSKDEDCIKITKFLTEEEPDGIDILINNSGAAWGEPLETYPEQAWDKILSLNVKGVFLLTRALLPLLEKKAKLSKDPSRIIIIGSVDGIRVPLAEHYAYSSSKAAVHQMTRVLASKFAKKRITVNCIAPGPFQSKMMAATLKSFGNQIIQAIPLGRIGVDDDIAGLTIFLASKAANWMTGCIIPLDGGMLIKGAL